MRRLTDTTLDGGAQASEVVGEQLAAQSVLLMPNGTLDLSLPAFTTNLPPVQ